MMDQRSPSAPCPCGSGQPFATCHGAETTGEVKAPVVPDRTLTHGYWLVAFMDLLGQKDAFLRTDYLPNAEDPEKMEAFLVEVRASIGVIFSMRKVLASFRKGLSESNTGAFDDLTPERRGVAERLKKTRVREFRMSDGVVLACPLMPEDGHFPIRAVWEIVSTCGVLTAMQLAAERPIRGGIDVGTGIEIDGELFGAALVKAYLLESKHAKYPRLAVGQDFVDYLMDSTKSPLAGKDQVERKTAEGIQRLLKRDSDQQWIVDYAGPKARETLPGLVDMLGPAKSFAERSRGQFMSRQDNDHETDHAIEENEHEEERRKLFERYSMLVRYLDGIETP